VRPARAEGPPPAKEGPDMAYEAISHQVNLPWSKAASIAIKSLKKRMARSMITMISVVLAIAFLMSIWTGNDAVNGLKALDNPEIDSLLMKHGEDLTTTGISSKMLWLVGLSLLVCSVGIVNAMLMSVTERFREIGTMKCLGALDGFIIKLFMVEALVQGAIGTAVGILIGLVIGLAGVMLTYGAGVTLGAVPVGALAFSALLSFVTGVILCTVFAIYPAYVAASMQPVEAMRVEE
jgi:hypothetical protein